MAFPPNYNLERNNRAKKKEQKLLEKQARRDEKAAIRKSGDAGDATPDSPAEPDKEPG